MDKLIYVTMSGADQILRAQTVNANNLANANTPGFRADLYNADSSTLKSDSLETRVFAIEGTPNYDFTSGKMMSTGRDLDIAIQNQGWIAVQTPTGEAYTRAGNLEINANGQLVTGSGYAVLGNSNPIAIPPAESLKIASDGTISIRPVGQAATSLATIDRIKLVNPDPKSLMKGPDGLFRVAPGQEVAPDAKVKIASGTLEGSNVNAVDSMINMISLARQFETQMKLIENTEQNSDKAAQLLQIQ